jgi:NitT/TauT family transport system substrate-binding protein
MNPVRSLLAGLVFVIVASGCGGNADSSGGNNGLEKNTIKVAVIPVTGEAPLLVGMKEKVFEQEGLKIETVPFQAADKANPALSNGAIDIGFGNHVTFIQGAVTGVRKVSLLAEANSARKGFVYVDVMRDSAIRTPKDLEGKTVAVLIQKSWQELTLNAVLRSQRVDTSKIRYAALPLPAMGAALQQGKVDAIYSGEPFLSADERKLGLRRLIDPTSGPTANWPVSGYYALQSWVRKYPKTAGAFKRAMEKAQVLAADRQKVVRVLPEFAKLDPKTAATITLDNYPTSTNAARIQRVADLMFQDHLIAGRFDVTSFIFTPRS